MNTSFASGAEELTIALQTPTLRGFRGVPALVWGRPGSGKTSFLEGLKSDRFPVVTLIASIHDPTDFSGLPVLEEGRVRFAAPEWSCEFDETQEGLLFIDELTTAPPSVQAALLRVVLERKVGGKSLPSGVRVAAAANPPDEIAGGWELTPPLANRFVHLDWDLSGTAFAAALQDGFPPARLPTIDLEEHAEACQTWRAVVSGFLKRNPALVHTRPADKELAYASPRTWDYAIRLMASCELLNKAPRPGGRGAGGAFANLLRGAIGAGATTAFVGYLKNLRLPDPEKLLRGKETADVGALQDDELYVLFCAFESILAREDAKASKALVDSLIVLFELVGAVSKLGRLDAVFAPLRKLLGGQIVQRAVLEARRTGRLADFDSALRRNITGELQEYVSLLGAPGER